MAREWNLIQELPEPKAKRSNPSPGTDPSDMVCHTDAAWNGEHKAAGFGWIFSRTRDDFRRQGAGSSEAIAVFKALQQASQLGFTNLSLASDSKELIEAINSKIPHKELHGILHDILLLSSSFQNIRFSFISRDCNRDADALAKLSLKQIVPGSV